MIVDSLRYWVQEMHVDAFRVDLSAVGETGGNQWHRWIDTALDSPNDIVEW